MRSARSASRVTAETTLSRGKRPMRPSLIAMVDKGENEAIEELGVQGSDGGGGTDEGVLGEIRGIALECLQLLSLGERAASYFANLTVRSSPPLDSSLFSIFITMAFNSTRLSNSTNLSSISRTTCLRLEVMTFG